VLAYWNSFDGVFVFDDIPSIRDNPHIRTLWPLSEAMSLPLMSSALTVDGRPLLSLTFALNHRIFGPEPWGYHLVNLLIHIGAGLLLFGIVRRTLYQRSLRDHGTGQALELPRLRKPYVSSGRWIALAVAAIWLVHPLQTESVTYIVQRAESLMGMLFLLTVYCAVRGMTSGDGSATGIVSLSRSLSRSLSKPSLSRSSSRSLSTTIETKIPPKDGQAETTTKTDDDRDKDRDNDVAAAEGEVGRAIRWYLAAILACAIGMGVKQTMFTAPLLVFLYDGMFISSSLRAAWTKRWRFYAALCATWLIVFGIIAASWQESTSDFVEISPFSYLCTQALVLLQYLRLSFWPSPLVLSYAWRLEDQWPRIVFPGLAILGMLAVMFRGIRRREWYGFVVAWFFLILAPTSSIAPTRQAIFEHRMYLSLAAVVVLVVVVGDYALRRACLAFKAVTLAAGEDAGPPCRESDVSAPWRVGVLADRAKGKPKGKTMAAGHETVFGAVLALALVILFGFLTHARNKDYHSELGIWRDNLVHQPESEIAHNNIGNALQALGRTPEAIAHYREALRIAPDYGEVHYNLGLALQATGQLQAAVDHYQQSLGFKPRAADAHNNLANALHALGRTSEAIALYREALRIDPGYAQAHYNLGYALQTAGRIQEAVDHYRQALRLDPEMAEALYNLGNVLHEAGRPGEAVPYYREALRLKPDYAKAHNNLGNAALALGRPNEAVPHYREALRIEPDAAEVHYNLGRAAQALGRPQEAVAHYRQALRLQPDFADAHYNLGNALVALGRVEDAIANYRHAVRINPDHVGAHNNLGTLYRESGRLADSLRHCEHAVRLKPDSAVARENLRQTKEMLGEGEGMTNDE